MRLDQIALNYSRLLIDDRPNVSYKFHDFLSIFIYIDSAKSR